MCLTCTRFWTALQVLWSTVYVTCGAAQVLAGIFFTISVPEVHLYSVIFAGAWNIVIGISGGLVACINSLTPRRQEVLLYMAVSILIVNLVNSIIMEYCFYIVSMPKLLKIYNNHIIINYACFATRIATAVVLVVSFFDSQFSFCSMQSAKKKQRKVLPPRGLRKLRGSHEQVSDIEYIIPRPKSSKSHHTVYNAYAQSWVFDSQENASCSNNNTTASSTHQPYFKVLQQNGDTPQKQDVSNLQHKQKKPSSGGNNKTGLQNGMVKENGHVIDNPVVHIEEASDDSNSNSDRKLCYMKSFSRSQSPMVLSASSSQISLNLNQSQPTSHHNPPIYEYLEKLTEPTIYRSRLNTALSNKEEDSQDIQYQAPQTVIMRRVESTSPRVEKVQYASLMKELQKAIVSKKETSSVTSPQSNTSDSATASDDKTQTSKSSSRSEGTKNSDADFSKELEAALQLIQDLESPNTIETPSEAKSPLDGGPTRALAVWRNSSDGSDGSEKTLSAVGSLAEITSPMAECQPELYSFKPQVTSANGASITVRYPDSQSTSGYSSPTHGPTPNWSTTSSINGSNSEIKPTSYSIHNTNSSTVISLYSSPSQTKAKSITLVKINSDDTVKLPVTNGDKSLDKTRNNEHGSVNSSGLNSVNSCENNSVSSRESNDIYDINSVIHAFDTSTIKTTKKSPSEEKTWSMPLQTAGWKLNSLLRRKKQNTTLPKLAPELEGAIIKSESLAYLSDLELLARHQRNQEMQREIEKRVVQQLSMPRTARTESNC